MNCNLDSLLFELNITDHKNVRDFELCKPDNSDATDKGGFYL